MRKVIGDLPMSDRSGCNRRERFLLLHIILSVFDRPALQPGGESFQRKPRES